VQTPLSIDVRRGAIAGLGDLLANRYISSGGEVAVVVGPGQGEKIAALLAPSLNRAEIIFISGGTLESALQLGEKLRGRNLDAVVGIGGGKTIDTAKYAAFRYGIPMVTVGTSLAHLDPGSRRRPGILRSAHPARSGRRSRLRGDRTRRADAGRHR
jgi:glycerol-1-phosphate dehydrogenase [NAD(P)+]